MEQESWVAAESWEIDRMRVLDVLKDNGDYEHAYENWGWYVGAVIIIIIIASKSISILIIDGIRIWTQAVREFFNLWSRMCFVGCRGFCECADSVSLHFIFRRHKFSCITWRRNSGCSRECEWAKEECVWCVHREYTLSTRREMANKVCEPCSASDWKC